MMDNVKVIAKKLLILHNLHFINCVEKRESWVSLLSKIVIQLDNFTSLLSPASLLKVYNSLSQSFTDNYIIIKVNHKKSTSSLVLGISLIFCIVR